MNPQQPGQQHQPGQESNHNQAPVQPGGQPAQPPGNSPGRFKAVLLILALAALAAGAAWFLMNKDTSVDEPETGAGEASGVEITITSDGFTPGSILVNPDTTVTWVNQDDQPHRVASNPHPDHDGLPGFDSQDPIFPGESYSYTFTETGEFGYHDHLNPETNGTVVVEAGEE